MKELRIEIKRCGSPFTIVIPNHGYGYDNRGEHSHVILAGTSDEAHAENVVESVADDPPHPISWDAFLGRMLVGYALRALCRGLGAFKIEETGDVVTIDLGVMPDTDQVEFTEVEQRYLKSRQK